MKRLLRTISQHEKLPIRLSSAARHDLPADVIRKLAQPHRMEFYFFVFIEKGTATYNVDMTDITLTDGQVLFVLPNQIFAPPPTIDPTLKYYKLAFFDQILAMLPQQYAFLVNSLKTQVVHTDEAARERIKSVFEILAKLLHTDTRMKETEILLVYLGALLAEFNNAYFRQDGIATAHPRLSKYIEFQVTVENHLTEQQSVNTIAAQLAVTTNSLYALVKEFSGVSPKEFITHRLILEAQRKLHYSNLSVKELAYELGFSDPDYFSRLFKKTTGKSVRKYLEELQDLSGT
ncbi:helix-turn-helix domain-containing protein [Taibaiella soli]|uniref:AraC family transcriptional regulator n=1 Tax=Taibaiella soli TaxID=1649169 RepID=A0A2W2BLF0_9BACT|nr:AraC family transcriptional regulator [Taibaiella soli]PZF74256.1 AraC family transcriptional regulator [Taibaiella soli]